jgi:excisionase family DNA binding protein
MAHAVTPEDTRSMLSPAEAARAANVSRKTIYREIERGELAACRAGHQIRINPDDFARWLEGTRG